MELKDIQENVNKDESTQKLSSKVIKLITMGGESERLGNIEDAQLDLLFNLKTKNIVYYSNGSMINDVIDSFLNLSVSRDGKMIDGIKDMFKAAEINAGEVKK